VHEAFGTLTILPGDPELSYVSLRFSGSKGGHCSCLLSHTWWYISHSLRNISHLSLMFWRLKSYSCFLIIFKCLIIIKLRSIKGLIPIHIFSLDSFSFNLNLHLKHAKRRCKYVHSVSLPNAICVSDLHSSLTSYLNFGSWKDLQNGSMQVVRGQKRRIIEQIIC
jgi:hypothetical protein